MSRYLHIEKGGLLTTIQDRGRTGYQQFGMVVAGAMDAFSHQVANCLVGNLRDEASMEITMVGPVLRFEEDTWIALAGGDLSPQVDGKPIPMWSSCFIRGGERLSFGKARQGIRTYLAVAGGFEVESVMGSRSTYIKAGIGGWQGRALEQGDQIPLGSAKVMRSFRRWLAVGERPHYKKSIRLRVVLGPQASMFVKGALETLFTTSFEITPHADRMGYRLKGSPLSYQERADILSDATAPGSIQVTQEGQPIILMADRQTTGGYGKIATVISTDLSILAQASPGHKVTFAPIDVEEAHRLYREQEHFLRRLEVAGR
ncbi:biotin-dependent carboxyltransferase family protein [Marininema halotolerans]|uniref:Antagonist of KipI n=1 Tax=Marininema halotolerans TaxID=1155944 RepID=A0A1I6TMJ2_9BACL|nr:biotin-dependent carboxyltransferase family protein [Marininema halotolerans]SFS90472.1 antagonist of KipI [Marininema halotolerans]